MLTRRELVQGIIGAVASLPKGLRPVRAEPWDCGSKITHAR